MSIDDLIYQSKEISHLNFSEVKGPRIVLNMIVKNESRIIERCLRSAMPIIDAYCISDTGSTDNTVEIIQRIMSEAGKPGEVYQEPFQNFGYNRTHALIRAKKWGDYALLVDADMELRVEKEWSPALLTLDGYTIEQRSGTMNWSNTRFIRLSCGATCVGPTHEYYDFPSPCKTGHLRSVWIHDIGDGGAKADKFKRDIRLLSESLNKDPNNCRTHFYLAQSYKDCGETDKAIEHYKRRIELGGWNEEIFYSWLQMGHMWIRKNEPEKAVDAWFRGYNTLPSRSESLYEICKLWRERSLHAAAYAIYSIGSKIPYPQDCCLFIEKNVYDNLWYYEYSVLAWYLRLTIDHRLYMETAWKCTHKQNMLSNYKFYVQKLTRLAEVGVKSFNESVERMVAGRTQQFNSSTPSLLKFNNSYLMNIRYVSYAIRYDGSYDLRNNEDKITTIQKRVVLDKDFNEVKVEWLDGIEHPEDRYQGVEDVKLFYNGTLQYMGTVQDPDTKKLTIGLGNYTDGCLMTKCIPSPVGADVEKNWVDCGLNDGRLIYSWSPLRIGTIEQGALNFNQEVQMSPLFSDVRGSSCGVLLGADLWFLVHIVSYESPRVYYHMLVVLDAASFALRRHSVLFKFTDEPIEYSCGLLVEQERICIGYSTWDRTTQISVIPRHVIEKLF